MNTPTIKQNHEEARHVPGLERNPFQGIRRKLLLALAVATLTPFLFVLLVGHAAFTNAVRTGTMETMRRIVEDHGRMIETYLQERRSDLENVLDFDTAQQLSDPALLALRLQWLQRNCKAFVDLGYIGPDGRQVAYAGLHHLQGKDYSEASWYQATLAKGFHISDVFLGYRNEPHFVVAVARQRADGIVVLRATMDPHEFTGLVERIRMGATGEAWVLDAQGRYQTEPRSGAALLTEADLPSEAARPGRGIQVVEAHGVDGTAYLYCTSWINDNKWLLVARQEEGDAFTGLQEAASWIAAILLLGGLIITVLAYTISGRLELALTRVFHEKEGLRDDLYRAARLAEIGEMTTGIAHEINNPLQVMKSDLSYMEMVMQDMLEKGSLQEGEDYAEVHTSMEQLRLQISRCAKITQSILQFGRQGESITQDLELRTFLPEVVSMVEEKAAVNGIVLSYDLPSHPVFVRADPGQLQQVILNLLNNALHAVEEQHPEGGGKVIVQCSLGEKGQVDIAVRDNGCGITPDNMERIFAPFFTTKPVGKGTGLGLSVCHGIVGRMGGEMNVQSTPCQGTSFTISLPRPRSEGGQK
ncbi:MAG: ATP-binding protein [Desulfovibrio sp.]|jgi:two-component system NtrC family sensor kinase|nr:ATP-binding protein [Desulfovibrio sp.]